MFGDMLRAIALAYGGKRHLILPPLLRLALLVCDISALVPPMPTVDRERVLDLAGNEPIDSAFDLVLLGVTTQPIADRLAHVAYLTNELDGRVQRELKRFGPATSPVSPWRIIAVPGGDTSGC